MLKTRKNQVIALLLIIIVGTAAVFVFSPRWRYAVLDRVFGPDLRPNSYYMTRMHEATKITAEDWKRPYGFDYPVDYLELIKEDSKRCKKCHGSMLKVKNGRPVYPLHYRMIKAPLTRFHCTDCHKKVDLGKRSPKRVTIRIDRKHCTRCHESSVRTISLESGFRETFLISNHGFDKRTGKKWLRGHARYARQVGVGTCRDRCHQPQTELDFCDDCHKGSI